MVDICLLGCGGSLPVPERYLTSLLFSYKGKKILIDCGEGTQVSMKLLGWGFKSIDIICFTHYHADHIIGLPGLLLTIANSGKLTPLTLIGPTGLRNVIEGLTVVCPNLPYEINLIEIPINESLSYEISNITELTDDLSLTVLPVQHSVPCVAYSFYIKRGRKFDPLKAKNSDIPVEFWSRLQKGETIFYENRELVPDMVLGEDRKGLKISYCTDTRPIPEIVNLISNSELFICEGMYGDDEDLPKAIQNNHMLFKEAAFLAKEGNVKELWLTHFSPALSNPELYLDKTKEIFENTILGKDRIIKNLSFD